MRNGPRLSKRSRDLLVNYPKLKVYVVHASGFFPQNALNAIRLAPNRGKALWLAP